MLKNMHHLSDNFIFRKIKHLRKTESEKTIRSLKNQSNIHLFKYEQKPNVQASSIVNNSISDETSKNFSKISENQQFLTNSLEKNIVNSFTFKRDFGAEHLNCSVSSPHSCTSIEFSDSIPSTCDNENLPPILLELSDTSINSISEQIANEEVQKVMTKFKNCIPTSSTETTPIQKTPESNTLIINNNLSPKKVFPDNYPRELALPEKVLYKGEQINVKISGPVHFLTANIHQACSGHNAFKNGVEDAKDNKLFSSFEKYDKNLCDFSDAFTDFAQSMKKVEYKSTQLKDVKKNPLTPKTTKLYYKWDKVKFLTSEIKKPESAFFLVQSNSYSYLDHIIEISQEWYICQKGILGNVNATFCFNTKINKINATFLTKCLKNNDNNSINSSNNTIVFNEFVTGTIRRKSAGNSTIRVNIVSKQDALKNLPVDQNLINFGTLKHDNLKQTIIDVENNIDSARQNKAESRNIEAKLIEKAILDISERISSHHEPLTRAQAEVNEELLRTKLAEMILNIGINDNNSEYNYAMLKEPLKILKNKLNFLEQFVEEEDIIKKELSSITQLSESFRQSDIIQKKEQNLKLRSNNIARMTPLISVVKNKLVNLESVVHKNNKDLQNSGRNTPYQERRTVHDLLLDINSEINTIHNLCRQNNRLESLNTVINVLSKMCLNLDKILDVLRNYKMQKKSTKKKKKPSNFINNESPVCHINLQKEEDKEFIASFIFKYDSKIQVVTYQTGIKLDVKQQICKSLNRLKPLEKQIHSLYKPCPVKNFPITEKLLEVKRSSCLFKNNALNNLKIRLLSDAIPKKSKTDMTININDARKKSKTLETPIQSKKNVVCPEHTISNVKTFKVIDLKRCEQRCSTMKIFAIKKLHAFISQYIVDEYESIKTYDKSVNVTTVPECLKKELKHNFSTKQSDEVNENSEFGDASSFISEDSPISFYKTHVSELNFCSLLRESPNAAKRQRSSVENKLKDFSFQKNSIKPQFSVNEPQQISLIINDEESVSEGLLSNVPTLFRRKLSKSNSIRETAILTDEDDSNVISIYNQHTTCSETFDLRRRNKRAVLNAIVFPEIKAEISVTLSTNSFKIDVERMSEYGRESVVMVSEEYYSKKMKIVRKSAPEDNNVSLALRNGAINVDENESDENESVYVDTLEKLNVSIMAKSVCDTVVVHLEEILWNHAVLNLVPYNKHLVDIMNISSISQQTNETMSSEAQHGVPRDNASVVSNIFVAENYDEARSITSHKSGSLKSIETEKNFFFADIDNISAYVIKHGSTASITCELNNYVDKRSFIQWYCGKKPINITGKKYDKISHDLLEVLVILKADSNDSQLYSIKVNNEIFPVAYLIIDDGVNNEKFDRVLVKETILALQCKKPYFISPPQTMFVMQGQTAIISCQMNYPNMDVLWFKEQQQIIDGDDDRIFFEKTSSAWYRIIIEDIDFTDQGNYYAFYHEKSTSINLVVEEKIDEREVQVSSAETDDDELSDYLVPIDSTATIACELDNANDMIVEKNGVAVLTHYQLHWQRNNCVIQTVKVGGENKNGNKCRFEHVQNENKHYLIIHNAQPYDSGIYSVKVNGVCFKVAQITIGNHTLLRKKGPQKIVASGGSRQTHLHRLTSN